MAVVEVLHKFQARRGSLQWTGRRESSETYLVVTDKDTESAIEIILRGQVWGGQVALPQLGQQHPFDGFAICVALEASPASDDPLTWTVSAKYETQTGDSTPPENPDPIKQKSRYQWGSTTERRIVEVDLSDPPRPLVNSAGQKFDPPIETDHHLPTLYYERNEENDKSQQARAYANAINKPAFTIFGIPVAEGRAKVLQIRSVFTLGRSGANGAQDHYFVNSVELVFREDGWDLTLLDIGTQERIVDEEKGIDELRNITDDEGEQLRSPQLLDGKGRKLKKGEEPEFLTPFKIHPRKDFGLLGIPS